jgi:hypothetical protein
VPVADQRQQLQGIKKISPTIRPKAKRPFQHEARLKELLARQAQLNARSLELRPPRTRDPTVARSQPSEVERLIQTTYSNQSKYGLMIETPPLKWTFARAFLRELLFDSRGLHYGIDRTRGRALNKGGRFL